MSTTMKTPTKKPGPLDKLYRRTDLTPEQVFQTLSKLRKDAEAQVEYLIELIDVIDGEPDLERDAGEEREEENEHADDSDREPSLGWPEGHVAQGQGMLGNFDDRELAVGPDVATARRRARRARKPELGPVLASWKVA